MSMTERFGHLLVIRRTKVEGQENLREHKSLAKELNANDHGYGKGPGGGWARRSRETGPDHRRGTAHVPCPGLRRRQYGSDRARGRRFERDALCVLQEQGGTVRGDCRGRVPGSARADFHARSGGPDRQRAAAGWGRIDALSLPPRRRAVV